MREYITLGFSILILVFLLFGFLWGIIRGLRKTISRGLFLLVISIVLVFVTVPITNALLDISANVTLSLSEDFTLQGTMTIRELIQSCLEYFLGGEFVSNNPELVTIITTLPILLLNSIIYLLLFWVCKIVLLPINWIFYKICFAPKKKKESLGFAFNWDFGDDNSTEKKTSELEPINASDSKTNNDFIESDLSVTNDGSTENNSNALNETKVAENSVFNIDSSETNIDNESNKIVVRDNAPNVVDKLLKEEKPKKQKKVKPPKHRLWGGLVGVAVGLVVTFNTMLPIFGFMSVMKDLDKMELKHLSDSTITLDNLTAGLSNDIINGYDSSAMNYITKYTGVEALGLAAFDKITTQTINGQNITLRKEVTALRETFQEVDNTIGVYNSFVVEGKLKKLTQEELNTLIGSVKNIVAKCREIKYIDTMTSYVVPVLSAYFSQSDIELIDNKIMNDLIVDTLVSLANSKDINVLQEIDKVLDIVDYVNTQGILLPIINNDLDQPIKILNSLSEDFGTTLSNKLFELKTVSTTLPHLINMGLVMINQSLDVDHDNSGITLDQSKEFITNLLNHFTGVFRSLSEDSPIYVTDNSLVAIGKLLNTIKGSEQTLKLFDDDTYVTLVDSAVAMLKNITNQVIPEELRDGFNNQLLSNVSKVSDWETEMSIIKSALDILRDVENGILGSPKENSDKLVGYNVNIFIREEVINNIGLAFDELEKSTLFGTTTSKRVDDLSPLHTATAMSCIVSDIFDFIAKDLSDDMQGIRNILSMMKTNLINSDHKFVENITFWKDEFTRISPLFVEMYNMLDAGELSITTNVGKYLDKARVNGVLLGGNTTLDVMKETIGIVEDSLFDDDFVYNDNADTQGINDKIYETLREIKENLSSSVVKTALASDNNFWTTEIKSYIALMDIADQVDTIESLSDAKTIASDLDKVFTSTTIPKTSVAKLVAFVIKDMRSSVTVGIEGEINNLLTNVATNLESPTFFVGKEIKDFWQIEFEHIDHLYNIELENFVDDPATDDDESNIIYHLSDIGKELDKVVYGYTETIENESATKSVRASYLITYDLVNDLISTAINENKSQILANFDNSDPDQAHNTLIIKSAVEKVIDSLQDNLESAVDISFETELEYISKFGKVEITASAFDYAEENSQLISLGKTFDSIAFNTKTISNSKYYDSSINSKLIYRSMINQLVIDIMPIAKINNGSIDKAITSMGETLSEINANDTVISWETEMSNVNKLMSLKNFTNLSDTEMEFSEAGKTLDEIAFNQSYSSSEGYVYNDKVNSKLITRNTINTLIKDLCSTAKTSNEDDAINVTIDSIESKIAECTTNNTVISWKSEMTNFDKLLSLKSFTNLSDTAMEFSQVGKTLDEIAFNLSYTEGVGFTFNDTINSKLITRTAINTLIKDLCSTAKTSNEDDAINTTIDSVATRIGEYDAKIFSWERELGYIDELLDLKSITKIDSTNYQTLGALIDDIAFKCWSTLDQDDGLVFADCEFNGNILIKVGTNFGGNSLLITRAMLNENISTLIKSADAGDSDIIKSAFDDVSASILTNSEKIYSWQFELEFINKLIELNETTIVTDNISDENGPLATLGNNIDSIGFVTILDDEDNLYYDDSQYNSYGRLTYLGSNSVIITRTILKNAVAKFLAKAKYSDPSENSVEEIINEIISNTTDKINTTTAISADSYDCFNYKKSYKYNATSGKYELVDNSSLTCAFVDLISVKKTIEDNNTNTKNQSITNLDATVFADIDSMLADLQSKLICGNITTRKVARLILVNLQSEMYSVLGESVYNSTESGIYLGKLLEHYDNNISNDSSEKYITGTGEFDKPFQTLKTKTI